MAGSMLMPAGRSGKDQVSGSPSGSLATGDKRDGNAGCRAPIGDIGQHRRLVVDDDGQLKTFQIELARGTGRAHGDRIDAEIGRVRKPFDQAADRVNGQTDWRLIERE